MTLPPTDPDTETIYAQPRQVSRHRLEPEAEPRRRLPKLSGVVLAALAVIAALLVAGVVLLVRSNDSVPVPDMTTPAGAPVVPVTPVPATVTHDPSAPVNPDLPEGAVSGDPEGHDGYRVGTDGDIPAGKYTTAGAIDGSPLPGQWWVRPARATKSGAFDASSPHSSSGPTTVILHDGDTLFTRGYKPWHKVPE